MLCNAAPSLLVFDEVLTNSFGSALEGLLGRGVRDEVYRILEKNGVGKDEVPSNLDKVIDVLLQVFGECSRVIIRRVLRVLYEKYSLPVDFSSQEILLDRLVALRNRIVVEHLRPRAWDILISYQTKEQGGKIEDSTNAKRLNTGTYAYACLFHPWKKGTLKVGSLAKQSLQASLSISANSLLSRRLLPGSQSCRCFGHDR